MAILFTERRYCDQFNEEGMGEACSTIIVGQRFDSYFVEGMKSDERN
jgi:hypothetical protein